jgi:ribosomal protein S18 acetylase RimI-like enzyme
LCEFAVAGLARFEGVLSASCGLSAADLAAIADLEQRVIAHDGGRLKLEWGALRSRPGDKVEDLLWRDGDRVTGFVGFYSWGSAELELAGMVDPAVRRTGIGTALLDAATPIAVGRGFSQALLITPRDSAAGRAFAVAQGGVLEHSEHFLSLGATPTTEPLDSTVTLRQATDSDRDNVIRVLAAGFGSAPSDLAIANTEDERTLVAERGGLTVATMRIARDGSTGSVYGLAVDPAYQGQGIGRDILTRICRRLRSEGSEQVTLEVAVDNERALDLYLSIGFEPQTTEDYYAISLT